MKAKTTAAPMEKLVELVNGKILLKDAPTLREVILQIYGVDIDKIKTFPQYAMRHKWREEKKYNATHAEEHDAYVTESVTRYETLTKFYGLIGRSRNLYWRDKEKWEREQKKKEKNTEWGLTTRKWMDGGKDDTLKKTIERFDVIKSMHMKSSERDREHLEALRNMNGFYIVDDEQKVKRVVHIIYGVNNELLLQILRRQQKKVDTILSNAEHMKRIVKMPEALRKELGEREIFEDQDRDDKKRWPCRIKDIDRAVREARKEGRIGHTIKKYGNEVKYKPNYESIREVVLDNICYVKYKYHHDNDGKYIMDRDTGPIRDVSDLLENQKLGEKELEPQVFNMLKDIVVADFEGKSYRLGKDWEHVIKMADEEGGGWSRVWRK